MSNVTYKDPFARMSRLDRRWWRAAERRARRDHEAEQLDQLCALAARGTAVTRVDGVLDPTYPAAHVELALDGRRLRVGRVSRRAAQGLRDALAGLASLPLVRAHRYGPYWVLTFRAATEQLVVLAEQLTLLPDWPGGGGGLLSNSLGPFTTSLA